MSDYDDYPLSLEHRHLYTDEYERIIKWLDDVELAMAIAKSKSSSRKTVAPTIPNRKSSIGFQQHLPPQPPPKSLLRREQKK
ncbi:hypothetical protein CIB48_g11500 [Xylaria polymorpha]|nr:hypothetical protein CIB48_g11500 [Xylaria polymorpha]